MGIFLVVAMSSLERVSGIESSRRQFVYPPKDLTHVTFGYGENMADSLWIRVIQDIEICDQSDRTPGLPPLLRPESEVTDSRCKRGWVFSMIDAITELAPRFRTAVKLGATLLSVVVDDREGAKVIFDKGLERFPDDGMLAFQAAYHYLFELRDREKAADLLVRAGKNGFPAWVFAAAANLKFQEGQSAVARAILEEGLKKGGDEVSTAQMRKRIDQINEALSKAKPEERP